MTATVYNWPFTETKNENTNSRFSALAYRYLVLLNRHQKTILLHLENVNMLKSWHTLSESQDQPTFFEQRGD